MMMIQQKGEKILNMKKQEQHNEQKFYFFPFDQGNQS